MSEARPQRPGSPGDHEARETLASATDRLLFVEAGAGTGKTTSLVERVLRLVLDGVEARHIAAITFTEAAASELRRRIRERLEAALRAAGGPDRQLLRAALDELDEAAISTLHGFAAQILRDHALEAGIPPGFEVLDEISSAIAFSDRWSLFYEELHMNPELELTALALEEMEISERWLRSVALELNQNWDRLEGVSAGEPARQLEDGPLDLGPVADRLAAVAAQRHHCSDPGDGMHVQLCAAEPWIEMLRGSVLDQIAATSHIRLNSRKGNRKNWPHHDLAALKQEVAELTEALDAAKQDLSDRVLARSLSLLAELTLRSAEQRRRDGTLEFHDLLVLAARLLRTRPDVRHALRDRYRRLLIDEFQDTDPIQLELAVWLAAQGDVAGEGATWEEIEVDGERLFFVGDPKQSIYRFRRADVNLYMRAQRRFETEHDAAVRLHANFRSTPAIVEWVNGTFAALIDGDPSGGQPRYHPMIAHREDQPAGPPVVLVGERLEEAKASELRAVEAQGVVAAICEAVDNWEVVDPDTGALRPASYRDVAILLPARTSWHQLEEALAASGVPYRAESSALIYRTPEVRELLTILQSIDDPSDEVAIVAALRSPALGCSDRDLFSYRAAGGPWSYQVSSPDRADGPVAAALERLANLHGRRWSVPVGTLVAETVRELKLLELGFARARPRDSWRRIRWLIDQARAYAASTHGSLRGFLRWAELQASEVASVHEPASPEPDDDAVRVLTVHAAKGLEFPIAVLSGMTTLRRNSRRGPRVAWVPGRFPEVSARKDLSTASFDQAHAAAEQMDRAEWIRLLYVAATRARDHLIVSCYHQADNGLETYGSLMWDHGRRGEVSVLVPHAPRPAPTPESPAPPLRLVPADLDSRQRWIASRSALLEPARRGPVTTPTSLAEEVAGAPADAELAAEMAKAQPGTGLGRGRGATALGAAVHGVLQVIDLASGEGLDHLCRAQATACGIPGQQREVARRVRFALASPLVQSAAASEHWRELYVAGSPAGEGLLEGYIDLLYRAPEGGLVIVDYKTISHATESAIDAAMAAHRVQGSAYALALESVTGGPVAGCAFLFLTPSGAIERWVHDLPAVVEETRSRLAVGVRGAGRSYG